MENKHLNARINNLNSYLSEGIKSVNGWCLPQLWYTIWPLAIKMGDGPIAEIGVYEGKFFIGLCKTFGIDSTNTQSAAIDVYDLQEFNLDGAGIGKLDIFKNNLKKHGILENNVNFIRRDSLSLTSHDANIITSEIGRFKFFSIDGCHEVVHTVNDVKFAMSVTDNDGIIAVDDYTNSDWPGVSEAISKMYLFNSYPFIPLAVTSNKLLLCSYSHHGKYIKLIKDYINKNHPSIRMKNVKRFGFDTINIHPNYNEFENLQLD